LSDEFNISVLTPDGVEIELPFQVFKQLKKLHLHERDRITGKRRIKKQAFEAAIIWDCFAHPRQKSSGFGANADWRAVYRAECRNPRYVIENGRPPVRSSSKLRRRVPFLSLLPSLVLSIGNTPFGSLLEPQLWSVTPFPQYFLLTIWSLAQSSPQRKHDHAENSQRCHASPS
jgi:hypothetical protein